MKKLLLVCLLALAPWAMADQSINRAGVSIDVAPAGCLGTITMTAATYALNNVTPTVYSGIQDLSTVNGGIMFNISGATNVVGQAIVVFEFSHVTYAAWAEGYRAIGAGSRCIPRNNRYMRLRNASSPAALSVTAAYWVAADIGASSTSGASGAAQAVSVIAGVAGVSTTATLAAGTATVGNVGVTSTPRALTYTEFSIFTTTALTVAATPIYLTTSAVSSVYIDNTFGAVTVSYRISNSSTVPSDMTTVKFGVLPGEKILIPSSNGHLPMDGNYLWYLNPGAVTITGKNTR